jgi:hypothetical protein
MPVRILGPATSVLLVALACVQAGCPSQKACVSDGDCASGQICLAQSSESALCTDNPGGGDDDDDDAGNRPNDAGLPNDAGSSDNDAGPGNDAGPADAGPPGNDAGPDDAGPGGDDAGPQTGRVLTGGVDLSTGNTSHGTRTLRARMTLMQPPQTLKGGTRTLEPVR